MAAPSVLIGRVLALAAADVVVAVEAAVLVVADSEDAEGIHRP